MARVDQSTSLRSGTKLRPGPLAPSSSAAETTLSRVPGAVTTKLWIISSPLRNTTVTWSPGATANLAGLYFNPGAAATFTVPSAAPAENTAARRARTVVPGRILVTVPARIVPTNNLFPRRAGSGAPRRSRKPVFEYPQVAPHVGHHLRAVAHGVFVVLAYGAREPGTLQPREERPVDHSLPQRTPRGAPPILPVDPCEVLHVDDAVARLGQPRLERPREAPLDRRMADVEADADIPDLMVPQRRDGIPDGGPEAVGARVVLHPALNSKLAAGLANILELPPELVELLGKRALRLVSPASEPDPLDPELRRRAQRRLRVLVVDGGALRPEHRDVNSPPVKRLDKTRQLLLHPLRHDLSLLRSHGALNAAPSDFLNEGGRVLRAHGAERLREGDDRERRKRADFRGRFEAERRAGCREGRKANELASGQWCHFRAVWGLHRIGAMVWDAIGGNQAWGERRIRRNALAPSARSCSSMYSSFVCACAILPGPKATAGMPWALKMFASQNQSAVAQPFEARRTRPAHSPPRSATNAGRLRTISMRAPGQ